MAACFTGRQTRTVAASFGSIAEESSLFLWDLSRLCIKVAILKDRVYIMVEDPSYGYWRSGGDALPKRR